MPDEDALAAQHRGHRTMALTRAPPLTDAEPLIRRHPLADNLSDG